MSISVPSLRFLQPFGVAAAIFLSSPACLAQVGSPWGAITTISAGWKLDSMAIYHSAPLVNPDNCTVTSGGYASDPADPGHSLFHTVALAAFLNHKEVSFVVSGCIFGKPKLIGISVR